NQLKDVPELNSVKNQIEISLVDEGLRVELIEDPKGVFFESGVGTPSARGRQILSLLGHDLAELPNQIRIEGYTDARPYADSTGYSNWELSSDRANAARRILVENGVRMDKLSEVRGHADHDLKKPDDPFAASNRRVSIMVLTGPGPVAPPGDSLVQGRTS